MVLTWRRGIFHRTLKAEQLIVSSWMSNGGLRRSVSCKKKKERQRKKTDRRRQWVRWLLEIFSPRLTPGRTFHKNAGFIRDESQTICSCLRAEKSSSILMKAEGLRSDWTRPEITRLPSRQPCCSYQMEGGGENEVNKWKCFLTLQVWWWYILWGLEWHFRRLCLGFQWPTSTWEPSWIYTGVGVRSSTPLMMPHRDRVQWWSLSMFLLFPRIFVVIPTHTQPTSCAARSSVRGVSPLHLQPLLPSDWSEWFDMSVEFPPPSPRGRGPVNQNLRIKAGDLNLPLFVYAGARVPP